jgi:recombination associated protein RdgC
MDLIDKINNTRYLGKEFLTWLWYRSETNEGLIDVPDLETIELWFDDKVVLSGADTTREQNIVKGEAPTESPEARVALRMGKKVAEAKLRVIKGQRKWAVNIKGETLALSGVKIPAVLSREEDDQVFERFFLLEEVNNVLLALYKMFIELRQDKESWGAELEAMRAWVKSEPHGA